MGLRIILTAPYSSSKCVCVFLNEKEFRCQLIVFGRTVS